MYKVLTYLLLAGTLCSFALHAQQADSVVYSTNSDTSRICITRLDLNSGEEDFSPVICNGKMLFTSARPASFGVIHKEQEETRSTNIYYASKKDPTHFSSPKLWPGAVNTFYNEGNAAINADENLIIFTANERNIGKKGERNRLCLYSSEKKDGQWQEPQLIWFCSDGHSYCHPALRKDGKTLFFASDRPGTIGGMDIYCSLMADGKWSAPQNVGTKVNTFYNELFPTITESNTLYFSSNRPGGAGGLDIYSLNLDDPLENELLLLEAPLNSAADDFGIFPDSSGESGYFSSSRNGRTRDDIYYYRVACPDFKDAASPLVRSQFCYTFFEETAVASDSIEYEWDLGDGTKVRGLSVKHCYSKPGTYAIQLNIVEKETGAIFYNEVSYEHVIEEPRQLKIQCPDELVCKQQLHFTAGNSAVPGYTIKKVYWDFGDHSYSSGPHVQHVFKDNGTYVITMGVIAQNNATGLTEKLKIEKTITIKNNL
jgi:hypothetical protein